MGPVTPGVQGGNANTTPSASVAAVAIEFPPYQVGQQEALSGLSSLGGTALHYSAARRSMGIAPTVHRMAGLADARRGRAEPNPALVVRGDAGPRWNTLVIVVPQAPSIRRGPYRWLHHPNYVAVVVEGVALPLAHTAWLTAAIFTLANALLLTVRIRVENAALGYR